MLKSVVTTLVLTLPFAVGCASDKHGHDASDNTATQMDQVRAAAKTTKEQASAATASLQNVVDKAAQDPKTAYAQFEKDLKAFDATCSEIESRVSTMRTNAQAYITDWEKQSAEITDPDLKKRGDERRAKLSKHLESIGSAMDGARTELTTLLAGLKDANKYLSNDLTPEGVKSISDVAKKLSKNSTSAGKKIDDLVEAIEKAEPEFKVAKPPPPPPAEAKKS